MDETIPDGWSMGEGGLARRFQFASFAEALGFMVEVGLWCETAQHHPDWTNSYDKLDVALMTHDVGRVTDKDRALARHMNAVFARRG